MRDRLPPAPRHLGAEGRRFWRKLTAEFAFESEGLAILAIAAEQLDRIAASRASIAEHGVTLDKGARRNPACDVEKAAISAFLRCVKQLGVDVLPPGKPGRPSIR